MNQLAEIINEGTKQMVEAQGKVYHEPSHEDDPATASPGDIKQVVQMINESTATKLDEQKKYRETYGHDPRGHTSASYSLPV